jgi:hypothetical protein
VSPQVGPIHDLNCLNKSLPDLEFFSGNSLVVRLNDREFVKEPIGSGFVGDVFGAIGEQHIAVNAVAISLFAAGELCELGFVEHVGHGRPLSFK